MYFISFSTFSELNKNFYLELEVPWVLLLWLLVLVYTIEWFIWMPSPNWISFGDQWDQADSQSKASHVRSGASQPCSVVTKAWISFFGLLFFSSSIHCYTFSSFQLWVDGFSIGAVSWLFSARGGRTGLLSKFLLARLVIKWLWNVIKWFLLA